MNFGDSSHKTTDMPDCFRLLGPKMAPPVGIGLIHLFIWFTQIKVSVSYLGFYRFPMGFHNIFGFILIIFVVQSKSNITSFMK